MSPHVPTSPTVPRTLSEAAPAEEIRHIRKLLSAFNHYGLNMRGEWLRVVFNAYLQPHRHFHTLRHLRSICDLAVAHQPENRELTAQLLLTALFHDIVWFPQRNDNEVQSAAAFDLLRPSLGAQLPPAAVECIRNTIIATKRQQDSSPMAHLFHEFDCDILLHGSPVDLLAYEFQIFREFQFLNLTDYRKGRGSFFSRVSRHFPGCHANMRFLIEYLERRRPRIGIYAGSFNPFHIGHLAILQKAELMFDKVIVAVGLNPEKAHRSGDATARAIKHSLPFHEVVFFDTLMVDLLERESTFADITLVRGLRNGYDLDYEMSQQCFMQEMRPQTHSVYIPCDKALEHISSSALRGLRIFDCKGRDRIYFPTAFDYYYLDLPQLLAWEPPR